MNSATFRPCLLLLICLIGLLGLMSTSWVGIQQDEALFLTALYQPAICSDSIFEGRVALMIMPYIGALKAWLYAPYLSFAPFTAVWFRLPMVALLIAVAVGMALLWRRQAAGPIVLAALAISFLHPGLLLATVMDWGPIGLQLLLTMLGMHAAARRRWFLCGLCAGLLLWDKAVAVWVLSGVAVATLLFYRSRPRYLPLILGFVLGALPYIHYNLTAEQIVMSDQAKTSLGSIPQKLPILAATVQGGSLVSHFFRTVMETHTLVLVLFLGLLFGWARGRLAAFLATAIAIALVLMMATRDAGGTAHHHLLVWPLLATLLVLSLQRMPRPIAAGLSILVLAWHTYLWQQHFLAARIAGPTRNWTDATEPAAREVIKCQGPIYALDWGFTDNINAYLGPAPAHRVQMIADDWFLKSLSPASHEIVLRRAAEPNACFLQWIDGPPFYPELAAIAVPALSGLCEQQFADRTGRLVISLRRQCSLAHGAP